MKGGPKRGVAAGKADAGRRTAEETGALSGVAPAEETVFAPASLPSARQRSAAIGPEVWPD